MVSPLPLRRKSDLAQDGEGQRNDRIHQFTIVAGRWHGKCRSGHVKTAQPHPHFPTLRTWAQFSYRRNNSSQNGLELAKVRRRTLASPGRVVSRTRSACKFKSITIITYVSARMSNS